jgi:hypothetical protein
MPVPLFTSFHLMPFVSRAAVILPVCAGSTPVAIVE